MEDREREGAEGMEVEELGNGCGLDVDVDVDVSEEVRSRKKVKLSHEVAPASSACLVGGRGARMRGVAGVGDLVGGGVKTRSRATGPRRFSMRNRR